MCADSQELALQELVKQGLAIRRISAPEVLQQLLPTMDYREMPGGSTHTSTQSYDAFPSGVVVWDLNTQAILAAADSAGTSHAKFTPLRGYRSPVLSSEKGVQQYLYYGLECINEILAVPDRWVVPPATALTEATGVALAAAADAKPSDEVLCAPSGHISARMEVKRP